MAKNVTVVNVDVPEKGDQYPKYLLHYIGDDGETWKIGNLAKNLSQDVRKKLRSLKENDKVAITMTKEGNYWNLTNVTDPVKQTTRKTTKISTEGRLSDVDKAQGAQRGNVLTNAVNLVIAAGVKDIDKALETIILTSHKLLAISQSLETVGSEPVLEDPTIANDDDAFDEEEEF